jgi:uncharacterized protein
VKPGFLLFILILTGMYSGSQVRPEPPRLYNNLSSEFPDFLNGAEAAAIEDKLETFSNETSNQIAIVVVDDLGGMDASQFAFEIGNKWGVGKQKFNNGVVILIKPTGGAGGRDLFIAVGYGLEGVIPDLMTKRIREDMYSFLKEGKNLEALDRSTTTLMQLAKGEISVRDFTRGLREKTPTAIIVIAVILLLLFFIMRGGGGQTLSRRGRNIFWGGGFGGFGGGFGGGRGWGGGSSGGGWGGFGGGGFGGGGSGGKW